MAMDKLTFDFSEAFRKRTIENKCGKCGICRQCRSCKGDDSCKANRSQNEKVNPGEDETEFYVQWHVTNKCVQQCKHCYGEQGQELGLQPLLRIADALQEFCAKYSRRLLVAVTGGDPMLRMGDLTRLIAALDARCEVLVTGHLLTDETLCLLENLPGLYRVQLSLDGPRKVHDSIRSAGSFDLVQRAVELLFGSMLEVALMMTISKRNVRYLVATHEIADSWGVRRLGFDRFTPSGESLASNERSQIVSPEELRTAYEQVVDWRVKHGWGNTGLFRPLHNLLKEDAGAACSIGISGITLMPDGTVYPCRRLPVPLGNLMHSKLENIWFENDFLNKMRDPASVPACADCEHLALCRGCRAVAYHAGDAFGPDPHCWR